MAEANAPPPASGIRCRWKNWQSHLREDISTLVASGQTEAAAFQIAVARVGNPGAVGSEFKKTSPRWSMPFVVGSSVWAVLAAVCLAAMAGGWSEGKLNLLLAAHIFSLTMGYVTAFLAGGFGIYGVCRQWRREVSAGDQQILNRAIRLFTSIAAVLVAGAFVLGIIWRGTVWVNDPRETARHVCRRLALGRDIGPVSWSI